jgi:hypothetical protein
MPRLRIPFPPPFGGVSTQPAHVRHPNQVSTADNVLLSVKDGMRKRPGSRFQFNVTGLLAGADVRVHTIERDDQERYFVLFGPDCLRVFDLDGNEASVSISDAAAEYLADGSPSSTDLRLVTVADYTLIANRKVTPEAESSPAYTVDKDNEYTDFDVMACNTPASGTYAQAMEDTSGQQSGYWQYDSGDGTFATWTGAWAGDQWNAPGEYWDDADKNPAGLKIAFQRLPLQLLYGIWSASNKTLTQTNAFASYTWQHGDHIHVVDGIAAPGWYEIAEKVSDHAIRLTNTLGADATGIRADCVGGEYSIEWDFTGEDVPHPMAQIALTLQRKLRNAGATDACIAWYRPESTRGKFIITCPWKGAGTKVYSINNGEGYAMANTGRPFYYAGGQSSEGTGSPASQTMPVLDRWTRKPAPNQQTATLTAATLPIKMVRSSITPLVFTVSVNDWQARLSGDADTNPPVSLVEDGRSIADVAFHRNRLVMAGDENIVLSQAGDFFDLWLDDFDSIGDSDPIDVSLTADEVSLVNYVIPFRKSLLIFTSAGRQFELNTPEALTPNTAAITPSTAYSCLPDVRPVVMGGQCYFLSRLGDTTQLMEYYYSDTQVSNSAADVSAHAAGYLPDSIKTVQACLRTNTVLILSTRE